MSGDNGIILIPNHLKHKAAGHDMLKGPCECGAWHDLDDWNIEFVDQCHEDRHEGLDNE